MPLKTALITGCGPGGMAPPSPKLFTSEAIACSLQDAAPKRLTLLSSIWEFETFVFDVTSEESIKNAVVKVKELTDGRLDILINNAGLLQVMPFADTSVSDLRRLYEVNVIAVWAVTQAFLPLLLEAQGLVVGLSSISSVFCAPFIAGYASSKAAVESMMRAMRRELAPLGVRVMVVKTGSVTTGLFSNSIAKLPSDSMYGALKGWIESKAAFTDARHQRVDEYAEEVVDEIVKDKTSAFVWKGGMIWVAWILSWLGWETMLDSSIIKRNGLDKLSYLPASKRTE